MIILELCLVLVCVKGSINISEIDENIACKFQHISSNTQLQRWNCCSRGSKRRLPSLVSSATWLACYRMGNGPRTKNGRDMAGEMAGGPRSGGPKWLAKHKIAKAFLASHLPGHLSASLGPCPISPAISRPFSVLGPFPIL